MKNTACLALLVALAVHAAAQDKPKWDVTAEYARPEATRPAESA